ncbi:MAG: hypothetical protein LUD01_02150, partial [Clostridiales bacterium]|nr:hypothetical protein [Clostridiales bacterium]
MTKKIKGNLGNLAAYGGLAVCIIIFSILAPEIWTVTKLSSLMADVIVIALMSVGAVFVYSLNTIDISIGGQVGLYATLMVLLGNLTGSLVPGIALSVVIAIGIGAVNGATGELLKINPIVSSLVFMMVLNGLRTLIYTKLGSRSISLSGINYRVFKSPVLMLVALVVETLIITYLF